MTATAPESTAADGPLPRAQLALYNVSVLRWTTWRALVVVCRAEGRPDQRPLRFQWAERWREVDQVLSSWLERGPNEADPIWRVFFVQSEGERFQLRVRENGWLWQCRTISCA